MNYTTWLKKKQQELSNLKDEIKDAFTFRTDEDITELEEKVGSIMEEYKTDTDIEEALEKKMSKDSESEIIAKMKRLGYIFKSNDEDRQEEIEQIKPELTVLKYSHVKKINNTTVYITQRDIDIYFDITTGKMKGKGARKYKDQILERVNYYLKYEVV